MYMAPEVVNSDSEEYDFPSDVWSLGVVLYTMVTGVLPWSGANMKAKAERASKGQYEQPVGTSAGSKIDT